MTAPLIEVEDLSVKVEGAVATVELGTADHLGQQHRTLG